MVRQFEEAFVIAEEEWQVSEYPSFVFITESGLGKVNV